MKTHRFSKIWSTMAIGAGLLISISTAHAQAPARKAGRALTVQFNDLDLDSPAGKATLDARIRNVSRIVCESEIRTGSRLPSRACHDDIRKQVLAQVERYQDRVGKGG